MDCFQFHVLKIRIFSYIYSMKKTLLSIFIFLFGITSFAGEPYFFFYACCKLYYERYKVKTMKMIQTTDFEVDSLVSAGGGKRPIFGGRAALVTTWTNIWRTGTCPIWAMYAMTYSASIWSICRQKSCRRLNRYFPLAYFPRA